MSKRWMIVAAIGQGVLFSLALTGAVRIVCLLLGTTLSESVAGTLFTISSLLTGALSAYLYARFLKHTEPKSDDPAPLSNRNSFSADPGARASPVDEDVRSEKGLVS